jgi:hypothetical protein
MTRDRLMPPSHVEIDPWLVRAYAGYTYSAHTERNYYADHPEHALGYDYILESGRSYMVGTETPMPEYLRTHRRPMRTWQKLAYQWCMANPDRTLVLRSDRHEWNVYKRGDCVEFGLPHQDLGGERHYVSQTGSSMILVNVD